MYEYAQTSMENSFLSNILREEYIFYEVHDVKVSCVKHYYIVDDLEYENKDNMMKSPDNDKTHDVLNINMETKQKESKEFVI